MGVFSLDSLSRLFGIFLLLPNEPQSLAIVLYFFYLRLRFIRESFSSASLEMRE